MSETWTIGELAEHAARALRDGAAAPVNGRVRDVPGERLIRWYTTIGLVDPPLTRRGRVARYGRRHLLQLVAIKRMQAAGHSIAEIQAALAGAEDHTLEAVSGLSLPHPGTVHGGASTAGEPPASARPLDDPASPGEPPTRLRPLDIPAPTGKPPTRTRPLDAPAGGPPTRARPLDIPSPTEEPPTRLRPLTGRARFWAERPGSPAEGPDSAAGRRGPEPKDPTAVRPDRAGSQAAQHTPAAGGTAPRADGSSRDAGHTTPRTGRGAGRTASLARGNGRGTGDAGSAAAQRVPVSGREAGSVVMRGVKLADGVRLVLDEGRALTDEDVHAVLAAAGPLLAVLEERELT